MSKEDKTSNNKEYVYINSALIKTSDYRVKDKRTRVREYNRYVHSNHLDKNGNKIFYAHIRIPSLEKRQLIHGDKAFKFNVDKETNLDLDDPKRNAYIQVPLNTINLMSKEIQGVEGGKNIRQFTFNNQDATYKVYFTGKRVRGNTWLNPEPVTITNKDLRHIFATTLHDYYKQIERLRVYETLQNDHKDALKDVEISEYLYNESPNKLNVEDVKQNEKDSKNQEDNNRTDRELKKMKFRVGDEIVHPAYGKGKITWIDEKGEKAKIEFYKRSFKNRDKKWNLKFKGIKKVTKDKER